MDARFFALAVAAAGLAGCASDYVPPRPTNTPGPAYEREMQEGRPGLFGDLTWNFDLSGKPKAAEQAAPQAGAASAPAAASAGAAAASVPPMSAAEQEEFKKWRESASSSERQEFEDWRAWQEWKRNNPK
jgi:hypothetical protein